MVRGGGGFHCMICIVDSTGRAGTGPWGGERPPGGSQELQSIAMSK